MVSKIGWVIAAIVFLIFFYFFLSYIITQMRSYGAVARASALRSFVQSLWIALFTSPGIPENWEINGSALLPGLMTALYKVPLVINETNGTDRTNAALNITLSLDEACERRAWNSTVRVYESDIELNSSLYNQTFCPAADRYLNSTEIVFLANFSANQSKIFFIYFSAEKDVRAPTYSVQYAPDVNFSYRVFSEEIIPMLSVSKLKALGNFTYEELKTVLGVPYEIYIEISD